MSPAHPLLSSPPNQTCSWSDPSLISGTISGSISLGLDCSPVVVSTSIGDNDSMLPYDVGVGPISIKFNKDVSPSILSSATSTDCSDQGIQLSMVTTASATEVKVDNNFISCVPLNVTVSGDIVVVEPDVNHMWYEATYKIRIPNSAVSDTGGSSMSYASGSYLSSTGFNTGGLVRWYRDGG